MGWTVTYRRQQSTLDFFRQRFNYAGGRVLDAASMGKEVYLAYEVLDEETGQGKGVICIICMIRWYNDDPYNFGYKDMGECSLPGYYNCPECILRQLTDFDFGYESGNENSREWRRRCWAKVRQSQQAQPRLFAKCNGGET